MNDHERKQLVHTLLRVAAIVATACLVILFFFNTGRLTGPLFWFCYILEPFFYGFAIAYLINPICAFFERSLKWLLGKAGIHLKASTLRMTGIILSLVVMGLALSLLIIAVLPSLIQSLSSLVNQIPGAVKSFQTWLSSLNQNDATHEIISAIEDATSTLVDRLQNFLQDEILPNLQTYVSNVTSSFMGLFNFVKNFGLGCIVASYLLGGKERFLEQFRLIVHAVLPEKAAAWFENELSVAHSMFSGFIVGKLLDSLIIGIICYIFTTLTNMPYAVLISVVVGVTNIIPFFGPYIGAIPSLVLLLTISPVKCLIFLVFIVLLQQFDGNILGPSILGDRLGISGIWILFSILVFSALWGFLGMIIGVPIFAVLYDITRQIVYGLLHYRKKEDMIDSYETQFPKNPLKKPKLPKKISIPRRKEKKTPSGRDGAL